MGAPLQVLIGEKMKEFKVKPATELEIYELMVAAYPDRFQEGDDDIWDEVMEFAEELFGDLDVLGDLLGRLVLLAHPMVSAINKEVTHCLGPITIADGNIHMISAIQRKVTLTSAPAERAPTSV